jgi:hypothetical protein
MGRTMATLDWSQCAAVVTELFEFDAEDVELEIEAEDDDEAKITE